MICITGAMRAARFFASLVAKGAGMDGKRAIVVERKPDGAVAKAALTIPQGGRLVCARVDFASWEPLYAEQDDGTRVALPSCFNLNDDAIRTLEGAC